jgi:hypothetical protein
MTHGPTKIDSKGECIYCTAKNVPLSDEHILPYFIGGNHVISDASCEECSKITTRFERDIARGFWGDARTSYNAPSRRKKKQKKYVYLDDRFNPGKKLKIPYSEYPAPMIFYEMDTAGFLLGKSESIDHSGNWKFKAIVDQKKLESFEKKYPGNLTAKIRFNHDSFARLIAKIGYGQIMCSLDPGDFNPICLPYILGEKSNLSYIVGSRKNIPEPNPNLGYVMSSISYGTSEYLLLIAEIRIIANNHTPVYHAVVGDVSGKENVHYVREKLITTYEVVIPDDTSSVQNPNDEHHWMPRVWPLPNIEA